MPPQKYKSRVRDFRRDERGAILIWFTVIVALLIGLIGLALEGASLMNLNSQMQGMSDSAAVDGAKELDGANDAIQRATTAARNAAAADSNEPNWSDIDGSGTPPLQRDLLQRPEVDGAGRRSRDVPTTKDPEAKYIRVPRPENARRSSTSVA